MEQKSNIGQIEKMNINKQIIRKIEHLDLISYLNSANDLVTFLYAMQEREEVVELLKNVSSPDDCLFIARRLMTLSRQLVGVLYANELDVPLAVYLWVLSVKSFQLSAVMAKKIADVPRCWWATKVAINILNGKNIYNDAGLVDLKSTILTDIISKCDSRDTKEMLVFFDLLTNDEKIEAPFLSANSIQLEEPFLKKTREPEHPCPEYSYDLNNSTNSG